MFCKTVWNGLHILPDGYIRLCSLGTNSVEELDMQRCRDKDGNIMHILTHDIKDIMNSPVHKQVRALNIKDPNAWSPHCECCKVREELMDKTTMAGASRRMYLMRMDTDNVVSESTFKNHPNIDGEIDWMPNSLDIRFGNLCNQKCIMCSPTFSNLWYEEFVEFEKKTTFGQSGKGILIQNATGKWISPKELFWYEDPRWWPKFETMMPHLRHIYITGGEPMVVPAHDEMLDRLIDAGYAKNIFLEYDTNCSAINDKLAQRWVHFNKVDIRGSIESIGEKYELIRSGGKWKTFEKNVNKLKEYQKETNNKVSLSFLTSCFQISTMMSYLETEQWCKEIGVTFHMRYLEGPPRHRVLCLPESSRQEVVDFYSPHLASSLKAKQIVGFLNKHKGNEHYNPEAIKEFVRFMDFLDGTRKTDWKKTIPLEADMVLRSI